MPFFSTSFTCNNRPSSLLKKDKNSESEKNTTLNISLSKSFKEAVHGESSSQPPLNTQRKMILLQEIKYSFSKTPIIKKYGIIQDVSSVNKEDSN